MKRLWLMLDPELQRKFLRFRSIRRGYYSFLAFGCLCALSIFLELIANSRALVVRYEGKYFFPTYGAIYDGVTFGLDYEYEVNYRELAAKFTDGDGGDFVILPPIPYNGVEVDLPEGIFPPSAPDSARWHYLGTDTIGRDVLARLLYGFRTAIAFAFLLLFCEYSIGVAVGCMMGYFGGWFDLLMQRLIEIWSNIPFIYVVIIISSVIEPTLALLVAVMVFFGWVGMTWYMRTETYREKARDYVLAARTVGASHLRIIYKHILPNALSVIVTFVPFSISSGMVALVSLDFLGFGLPPSYPSIGELLSQGVGNLEAYWIVSSVVVTMIVILTMVTFIGEAIREAFDPKKYATYE